MQLRLLRLLSAVALAATLFTACTVESHSAPVEETSESSAAAPVPSAAAQVHDVVCGCALDEVGHCGEYIRVDGEFVELKPPVDLGSMPFCHKDGLKAKVDGKVEDGVFVATTFAYVE